VTLEPRFTCDPKIPELGTFVTVSATLRPQSSRGDSWGDVTRLTGPPMEILGVRKS